MIPDFANSDRQFLMANEVLWTLVNSIIRVIGILLIDRLLGNFKASLTSFVLILLSVSHGLAAILDVFLICQPVTAAFDDSPDGKCGKQVISYVILEAFGALIDLVILSLPIPSILAFAIGRRKKVFYSSMISTGIL